jgi:Na+/melibiose symporter-like transporter
MVRGSFRTVLTNPRLLKLNLGILCVHTLLMSSFVALPPLLERAGLPRDSQWQAYLVTMLIAFVSVVPFIIYAEKHRQMKRVFIGCVVVMLAAELVLWQSGQQLWGLLAGLQLFFIGFNVMECTAAVSLISAISRWLQGHRHGGLLHQPVPRGAIGGSLAACIYSLGAAPGVWRLRRPGPRPGSG